MKRIIKEDYVELNDLRDSLRAGSGARVEYTGSQDDNIAYYYDESFKMVNNVRPAGDLFHIGLSGNPADVRWWINPSKIKQIEHEVVQNSKSFVITFGNNSKFILYYN